VSAHFFQSSSRIVFSTTCSLSCCVVRDGSRKSAGIVVFSDCKCREEGCHLARRMHCVHLSTDNFYWNAIFPFTFILFEGVRRAMHSQRRLALPELQVLPVKLPAGISTEISSRNRSWSRSPGSSYFQGNVCTKSDIEFWLHMHREISHADVDR